MSKKKKDDPVEIMPILSDGEILFSILFYDPLPRDSANILKRTLAPLLATRWQTLSKNEGMRIAELRGIVESQVSRRNPPRFSLIFPNAMSMINLKKPA